MSSKSARKRRQHQADAVRSGPAGSLAIDAVLSRCGVFPYEFADGIKYELRPPDEILSEASWSTLKGAPVTVYHPLPLDGDGAVRPDNWRQLTVGVVGDDVRVDGRYVRGTLRIYDQAAIDQIESGALMELSPGYEATLSDESGIYDGAEYSLVQRDVRYNHVALLPRGANRQGPDVALKFDGRVSRQDAGICFAEIDDMKFADAMEALDTKIEELTQKLEATIFAKLEAKLAEMLAAKPPVEGVVEGEAPPVDGEGDAPPVEGEEAPPVEGDPTPVPEEGTVEVTEEETVKTEEKKAAPPFAKEEEEKKQKQDALNEALSDIRLIEKATGKEASTADLPKQLRDSALALGCTVENGDDAFYRGFLAAKAAPRASVFANPTVVSAAEKPKKQLTMFDATDKRFNEARK